MSTIDTGLGWSCDSSFYVDDTTTALGVNRLGETYRKVNAGAAICGKFKSEGGYDSLYTVSTVADNVVMNPSYANTRFSIVDGTVWYLGIPEYGCEKNTDYSDFPWVNENDPYPTITTWTQEIVDDIVAMFLTAANVQSTAHKIPTTDYVKSYVEGVEAETATRVNALNTVKQPKTMSSAVSVGGVSQSTVENAISAIATKISKIDFDIHRNLGTEITAAQKLAIANGTFEDLPIGAYWTLNETAYRIAHHDYYFGTGNIECTSHHIVVVPDNSMYNAKMNSTNTTTGGYANSEMRTTNLATALSTFETDFGAAHILNHKIMITNAVTNGQTSGWAWVDSKIDLMSENMVCGHTVWGQSGYETGVERGQLALFSLCPEYIQKQRSWYWLRSVAAELRFCRVNGDGGAADGAASLSGGVRPYAVIYFDDVLT